MWLATEGGVARFDGYGFSVLAHETRPAFTSNDVSAMAEVPAGVLWFGTTDGLIRMEGATFRRFAEEDGLPSASVVGLEPADDGSLLVLTTSGVVRFDGTRFKPVAGLSGPITALARGRDGTTLLLGPQQSFRYSRGSLTPFVAGDGKAHARGPVLDVQSGPGGALWVAGARSVDVFTGSAHKTFALAPDTPVQALSVDREGTAWVGTRRGVFTAQSSSAPRLEHVDALGTDSVLSLFQDREGNLWVGTENTGLHVLRPRKFSTPRATLGEATTAVAETSDGTLCYGMRTQGVECLRGSQTVPAVAASALTSPIILSLAAGTHGDLWAGTPDGLNHIDHGTVHKYTAADGLPDDFIRSVLVTGTGVVWLGTRYGLAQLDGGKIRTFTQHEGLPSNSVGPLLLDAKPVPPGSLANTSDGSAGLWIGTATGLSRWSNGTFENFRPEGTAAAPIVTAMAQDSSGTLWVALHGAGVSRLSKGRLQAIPATDLPDEVVGMVIDKAGYLWLRGKRGIFRASLKAMTACATFRGRCRTGAAQYGALDGMPSEELTAEGLPSLLQTRMDVLWMATRKGLAFAHPLHLPFNNVAPPVAIERFAVDDVAQPLASGALRVGTGHHSFTFDYAAPSFTMPSRTTYKYKLEGLDRDWVDAGSRRTAYYTSLPGRSYRFRVIAANNDGVWNDIGAELRFRVQPPVYLRWWFFILVALVLLATVAAAFRLRFRYVQTQFSLVLNERNRVAREIHDTLAQDFVSVSLQLELIAQMVRANRLPEASAQLQATRSMVKSGLEAARQSIWDLRSNLAKTSLPVRVREAVDSFGQTHPGVQVKIGGAYRKLNEHTESQVLRIVQESLSNVGRHAAATKVMVEMQYERDELGVTVRDNGRGFSPAQARDMGGRYGLRGMEERAALLGGKLSITSGNGEGTTVTLTVPLRAEEEL